MNKAIKSFIKICKMKQMKLKDYLYDFLKSMGYSPIKEDGFVFAEGIEPVCLTAHMDTVHEIPRGVPKEVKVEGNKISSPQGIGGDDRCGIYMICDIIKQGYRPYVLFCEDEEIGGVGSSKFCKTEYINMPVNLYIELDRAHKDDLVFYQDGNKEFHLWCEEITGYYEDFGSFSDISELCPASGIAGVNISCGYYQAHQPIEYVMFNEMLNSIEVTKKLIEASRELEKPWEYIEQKYSCTWWNSADWGVIPKNITYGWKSYVFVDESCNCYTSTGDTLEEAVGCFLMDNPNLSWGQIVEIYDEDEFMDTYGNAKRKEVV